MTAQPEVIALWPGAAPGSESWTHQERRMVRKSDGLELLRNIVRPTLTVHLPDPATATGTGVVVAPGGAFHFLADAHEGIDVATWLTERGIAALVLRYRVLPTVDDDDAFEAEFDRRMTDAETIWSLTREARDMGVADGLQAMRVARRHAGAWGLDPERIGIMGFSAGGYVASWVALQNDPESRPAFVAPIYAALFGGFSVPAGAPPMFLAFATDDPLIVPSGLPLYAAWREAGQRVELHAFSQGGHGFGMRQNGLPSDHWIDLFHAWLKAEGFLPSSD